MTKNDSFGKIYDDMNYNYSNLERLMNDLFQYIQNNPSDEMARDVFDRLETVGQNMLFTQKEFTSAYCEPSFKNNLVDNLDSKSEALKKAQEDIKAKSL